MCGHWPEGEAEVLIYKAITEKFSQILRIKKLYYALFKATKFNCKLSLLIYRAFQLVPAQIITANKQARLKFSSGLNDCLALL
jgi:hypothetical protein